MTRCVVVGQTVSIVASSNKKCNASSMPEISRFYGVVIRMFHNDHDPPHFHAQYQEFEAKISIERLEQISGNLPKRALAHILEWAFEHRPELMKNWKKVMNDEEPKKIKPLT